MGTCVTHTHTHARIHTCLVQSILFFIIHNYYLKHMLQMYWRYFWVSLINVLNANLCRPVNTKQIYPSPSFGGDSSVDDF